MLRRGLLLFLTALCLLGTPNFAHAQAESAGQTVSVTELEKLVGTLENEAERQRFVDRLKALIEAERRTAPEKPAVPDRVAARFLANLSDQIAEFGAGILRAAAFISDAPKLLGWISQQAESEWSRQRLTEIFSKLAIVMLGGWIAEWIAMRALARPRRTLETREIGAGWARAPYILLHAVLELVPIVVFALAAFAILGVIAPTRTASLVTLALINAILIGRAVALVAWAALAPTAPRLRLLPLSDETANYVYIWVRRLANVSIYGYFIAEAALLIGLPLAGHTFLLKLLGVIVTLLMIILILQARVGVSQAILGDGAPGVLRRRLADLWHVLAILYVLTMCFIYLVQPDGGFEFVARATLISLGIILGAWVAASLLQGLVAMVFRLTDDVRHRFPALETRANQYLHVLNIVILVTVYGFAALAIFHAWGFGSLDWLGTESGRQFGGSLVSIGVTIVVALVLWELVNILLDRYLARALGGGLDELRRAARVRTLMPLLQNVMFGVLAVFVVMVALSEIGVNIAPLLAGAGVVGIAIGFGAQTLMKDLFSGLCIVLEDSIAVGDIVAVGDKGGFVEWMSLRVMRLRDFDGTVHVVPFGEVQTISNRTKDFAFAVFRIRVSYGTDIGRVQRVVREVAAAMRADPEFGPMITADIELHGVESLTDASIVLARLKVLPAKQWAVSRQFNVLLKQALDREGIEIPFPQSAVHLVERRTRAQPDEAPAQAPS